MAISPFAAFLGGALNGLGQARARNYADHMASDEQNRREADAQAQGAVHEWNALTQTPVFQGYDLDTQSLLGQKYKQRAGPKYAGQIVAPGDLLGSAVTMTGRGGVADPNQPTPTPVYLPQATRAAPIMDPAKMGTLINGAYKILPTLGPDGQASLRATLGANGVKFPATPPNPDGSPGAFPTISPAPLTPRPLDASTLAKNEAQTTSLKQATLDAFTKARQADFDANANAPLAQKQAVVKAWNDKGAILGVPPLPAPGDVVGQTTVPRGPNLPGPPTPAQFAGTLANNQPGYGFDPAPPKVFDQKAAFPLSGEMQNQISTQQRQAERDKVLKALADKKQASEDAQRAADNAYKQASLGATVAHNQATVKATERGQDIGAGTAATRLQYEMSKPAAGNDLTPAQVLAHDDRVNGSIVPALTTKRDKALQKAVALESLAQKSAGKPGSGPFGLFGGQAPDTIYDTEQKKNVPVTPQLIQQYKDLAKQSRAEAAGYQKQIDQAQKPVTPARHPTNGRFITPPKSFKSGPKKVSMNGYDYSVQSEA